MTSIVWKILLGLSIITGCCAIFFVKESTQELQTWFLISMVLALWAIAFKIK
jgi:hypothetical protein